MSACLGLALLAGCKPAGGHPPAKPLVLASNPAVAALAERIGAPFVEVRSLGPTGGCGHGFQPTEAEMVAASKAKLWLCVDLDFEHAPWATALTRQGVKQVDLADALHEEAHADHDHAHAHGEACACCAHEGGDPHVWLSLTHQAALCDEIGMALTPVVPTTAPHHMEVDAILHQAQQAKQQLEAAHAALKQRLAAHAGAAFVADHPAYGHFAEDYGLVQLAIERNGQPPTDAELLETLKEAKAKKVRVVFAHDPANTRLAERVATELGVPMVIADPGDPDVSATLTRMAAAIAAPAEPKP